MKTKDKRTRRIAPSLEGLQGLRRHQRTLDASHMPVETPSESLVAAEMPLANRSNSNEATNGSTDTKVLTIMSIPI